MMNFKLLLTVLVVFFFLCGMYLIFNQKNPLTSPETSFNLSQAAVIKEMKQLNRLETASFTIEKIIEAGKEGNLFQDILYGDKILLIAHGEVIAGFDLSQINDNQVVIKDQSLTVTLPAPQILVTNINNEKTKVYDRKTGLLSKGDKDLESEARQKAEITIRAAACEAGILTEASENAKKQLAVIFKATQFKEVTILVPEATCN